MKFHQMLQLMAEIRSIIEVERPAGQFIILGSPSPTLIKKVRIEGNIAVTSLKTLLQDILEYHCKRWFPDNDIKMVHTSDLT